MDVRVLVESLTTRKVEDLFRAARELPAERLEWAPGPSSRPALDMLQECAVAPLLHIYLLRMRSWEMNRDLPEIQKIVERRAEFADLRSCEWACRQHTERLLEVVRVYPDEHLGQVVEYPFNGGIAPSMAEVMLLHFWNMSYHEGQIYYIQSLLPPA